MKTFEVITHSKDQIADITEKIQDIVSGAGISSGVVHVFVTHTTCAVTTADLDPGTDEDYIDFLRHLVPKLNYRHPHDPEHAPDHLIASTIGPSVAVPFENKKLVLGTWQRIILVELDGPRERNIAVTVSYDKT